MDSNLKLRASANFERYLKSFLDGDPSVGLPVTRLSVQDWKELNSNLAEKGVVLVPNFINGKQVMKFEHMIAETPVVDYIQNQDGTLEPIYEVRENQTDVAEIEPDEVEVLEVLPAEEDEVIVELVEEPIPTKDFGPQLKSITGIDWEHKTPETSALGFEHYRMPLGNMSSQQAQQLINTLEKSGIDGVRAIRSTKGRFLLFDPANTVLDAILGEYTKHNIKGGTAPVYIYDTDKLSDNYELRKSSGLGKASAMPIAERINAAGKHYAIALGKTGSANQDYIVISIKKSDALSLLDATYENGILLHHKNSAEDIEYLNKFIAQKTPLTHIGNTPVIIESMDDIGSKEGRAIILVDVGGKKLPFYISSGTAGKTDVPTGKWEFFGGITEKGWFRKGSLEDILSHYKSPELKEIADALDGKIGDIRDSVDVLRSAGREYLGGTGDVAYMINMPEIDTNKINQDVFSPENEGIFPMDLRDIKMFLGDKSKKNNNALQYRKSEELVRQQTTEKEKKRFSGLFGFLKSNKNENG